MEVHIGNEVYRTSCSAQKTNVIKQKNIARDPKIAL